ncbi:MAG: cupin domain-containing protein [Planctomycetota bacterium]
MKLLLIGVVAAALAAPIALQSKDVNAVAAKDIKWTPAKNLPGGVMSCQLHGDPTKGPVLTIVKVPAGTLIPPHFHGSDEVPTVISGAIWVGQGETVDESKGTLVEAGGYVNIPAKAPHWAKAKTDAVFVRYSNGPADITYCSELKK